MKMKLPLPIAPKVMQKKRPQSTKNTAKIHKKLDETSKAFRVELARGNYDLAYQHVLTAYKLAPNNVDIIMNLAYVELQLGVYEKAFSHYKKAILQSSSSVNTNIYDGITVVSYFLKKPEDVKYYGALAIQSKKDLVANEPLVATISSTPPVFNPANKKENVIAFSLFGKQARYCETAMINMELAQEIYPEWTCRFYVDDSIPKDMQQRLEQKGAEVIQISPSQKELSGLFWRFFVMDDPKVKRFLIRDADSLVSWRERAAVDEWLQSDKWFHTMHDFHAHTELILAGMWGGCTGVFDNIEQQIRDYIATGKYLTERVMDQHYLRYCVWPTIAQSVMIHDSQDFDVQGRAFPLAQKKKSYEERELFHVGMNEGSSRFEATVSAPGVQQACWTLVDENKQVICRYLSPVIAGKIVVDIPRTYAQKLSDGEWGIRIDPIENAN